MFTLYLASVWLHILAAITWIGGSLFLVLVAVPWLRRGDRTLAARFLTETGPRLRAIGWICFAILAVTGSYNLWVRGVDLASFGDPAWRASPLGRAALAKLAVYALVLIASAVHDFSIGPRAVAAIERDPTAPDAVRLRRLAAHMGRANVVAALVLVALGVILVRGWPT
ncbi:MAG: DUF4149 domain-containing protein [Myxococcales bacterium]|nr:DUF4149 domain-containing protein [Myxococcales bacterium]